MWKCYTSNTEDKEKLKNLTTNDVDRRQQFYNMKKFQRKV